MDEWESKITETYEDYFLNFTWSPAKYWHGCGWWIQKEVSLLLVVLLLSQGRCCDRLYLCFKALPPLAPSTMSPRLFGLVLPSSLVWSSLVLKSPTWSTSWVTCRMDLLRIMSCIQVFTSLHCHPNLLSSHLSAQVYRWETQFSNILQTFYF